jgi:hypothetical protein
MDEKLKNINSTPGVVEKPTPVIILPSKQYDYCNYRHYSNTFNAAGGSDFSLDINLLSNSYLELSSFRSSCLKIQDTVSMQVIPEDYFVGYYDLQILKVSGGVESLLGRFFLKLKEDKIENKHLIFDGNSITTLRFKIDTANISLPQGWIPPGLNLNANDVRLLLNFDFIDYPNNLFEFHQSPNIYI